MKLQKNDWNCLFARDKVICRAIAAWSSFLGYSMLRQSNFDKVTSRLDTSMGEVLLWSLLLFALYTALSYLLSGYPCDSWWLLLGATACVYLWISNYPSTSNRFLVTLAILVVYVLFVIYAVEQNRQWIAKWQPDGKTVALFAACFAIVAGVVLAVIGCLRYLTFSAPNYDFGIFCNMFENMRKTGLPITTCERDVAMSHFGVHISPIFYLLLPFYWIFPSPLTLQIGQAVIVMLGVIPLVLLAKHYRLSGKITILLSLIYCFYPVLSTGCFYDIHENCFLTVLLLWCFYFFEREKPLPMYLFALLVLSVKEDAAIYLLIFAAYVILSRKKYLHGGILALLSIAYFVLATYLINTFGDGILNNRFDNLTPNADAGLLGVVQVALTNPGFLLTQLFTEADNGWDKIYYLLMLFLPLAFLPFMTKRASKWLLLGAMLINFLSHYQYLYHIGFQYHFGVVAFLMYAVIQNISELQLPTRRTVISIAAAMCCGLYLFSVMPNLSYYTERWQEGRDDYALMEEVLAELPPDASLNVSTFLLAHVADHEEVYEVAYHDTNVEVDYVVLDKRDKDYQKFKNIYLLKKYTVKDDTSGLILVLQHPTS